MSPPQESTRDQFTLLIGSARLVLNADGWPLTFPGHVVKVRFDERGRVLPGKAPKATQAALVTGIVQSAGGFSQAGAGSTLVLLLMPWLRTDDRKPLDRPLRVEAPVAEAEIARAMKTFEKGSTVQLEVERLEGPTGGRWSGLGRLPVHSVEAAPALETLRQSVERPGAIEDPRLGQLILTPGAIIAEWNDQQMNDSYDGEIQLAGYACELSIGLTRGSRFNTSLARARDRRDIARASAFVEKLDGDLKDILGAVVRQFLPLYNEKWRANPAALMADAFRKRLEPSSLSIWSPGSARLRIEVPADHIVEARYKAGRLSEILLWK
jgi:hypothetical protein